MSDSDDPHRIPRVDTGTAGLLEAMRATLVRCAKGPAKRSRPEGADR